MSARGAVTALVVAAMVAGCGGDPDTAALPTSPPAHLTGSSAPSSTPTVGCRVFPPRSLTRSLHRQWKRPRPGQIRPLDSSAPGPWIAAEVHSKTFTGVALVDLDTNEVRPIGRFSHHDDWAEGAYDGTSLVWVENHGEYAVDHLVKWWDERSGRITVVGRTDPRARPGTTSASAPVLGDGHAAWVEGAIHRRARLVALDLASGRTRVVATGRPTSPLIHAGNLVWRNEAGADDPYTTHAVSLDDGTEAPPPPALAAQTEQLVAVSDGRAITWIDVGGDKADLYYSADGAEPGRVIARIAPGGFNLAVQGRIVIAGYADGLLAVNADGTAMTVTLGGGGAARGAGGFVVMPPNLEKSRTWPSGLAVVQPKELDLRSCG